MRGARKEPFTANDTDVLVRAVKDQQRALCGGRNPPRLTLHAWEDIARIVSAAGVRDRTSDQCRKRYSDVKRRGKRAGNKRTRRVTPGEPSSTQDPTPAEDVAALTLTAESVEEFGGLEIGTQTQPQEMTQIKEEEDQEERPGLGGGPAEDGEAQTPCCHASGPALRGSTIRPEDHPFLQLQQSGFDMLQLQLSAMRQSVDARLDRLVASLQPLGRIASSLESFTAAMKGWALTAPPPAPPPPSPPSPPLWLRPPTPRGARCASTPPDPRG